MPNIPAESKSLGEATLHTASSVREPRVLKPVRWEREEEDGLIVFTAPAPESSTPFSATSAAEIFEWLLSQQTVPNIDVSEPVGERGEWLDQLEEFLIRFGDVSRGDPRRAVTPATRLADGWTGTMEIYKWESLRERGITRAARHETREEFLAVGEAELTMELVRLWTALRVVLLIERDSAEVAAEEVERLTPQLDLIRRGMATGENDEITTLQSVRFWLARQLDLEAIAAHIEPGVDDQPARINLSPRSAVQLLWLILAVTIRAIEPPFETPGVHRCDYCNKLFVGDRSGIRGDHVFCSPRHGKSFWARRRMREKRAAEKAERELEKGQN